MRSVDSRTSGLHGHSLGAFVECCNARLEEDGESITLQEAMDEILTDEFTPAHNRSIEEKRLDFAQKMEYVTTDLLDVEATARVFQRFDNFNDSYNPMGKKARIGFLSSLSTVWFRPNVCFRPSGGLRLHAICAL